ncbi:MAG: nucleotide sugar dehydrogenase [Proteobacteria bacterium]|nr:nucleotide sugar dehydrogenase [Pseudomonadota bacterium]
MNSAGHGLIESIVARDAIIGVVGLGYVGLPLACLFAERGFQVLGFDVDVTKTDTLNLGASYIEHIPDDRISAMRDSGKFVASTDFAKLREPSVLIICVPTPLTKHREPDLQYIEKTGAAIGSTLRPGQIVILESSTYPGTTRDVLKPLLEAGGLRSGTDFFLAYSPEREDPANVCYSTSRIPKIVGGDCQTACDIATILYDQIVVGAVAVRNPETAEFVKLAENIFRAVNIALVNELKVICMAMGVDVWEVIEAAATKPFGFMPFYPGPGLGGHCIPVDPFYLTWKAREFGIHTKFIELAGEVNAAMPEFVINQLTQQLSARQGIALRGAKILMLGIAYKKNVDDLRESPALVIYEMLLKRGAIVSYHDPHIGAIKPTRDHPALSGHCSKELTAEEIAGADAVLIVTDHDQIDYDMVVQNARLVVDTRNAVARAGIDAANVFKA